MELVFSPVPAILRRFSTNVSWTYPGHSRWDLTRLPAITRLSLQLHEGDHFSLYTDGLLEARNESGELYGFDRLEVFFGTRPSASQASEEAVAFGQEDDVTVLTLTRLAAGQESFTLLSAPVLAGSLRGKPAGPPLRYAPVGTTR